jgi:DNA-binding GntR family transcriptional regulator
VDVEFALPRGGAGARSQQLPDEAASYVRELVISGAVRAGEFLRLEPIADAIGTSITPVREGLRMLQNEGFVRLVPRRGFVVEGVSQQDIHDLFWSQAKLAGELAARAALKISDEKITELQQISLQYEQVLDNKDSERMAQLGHHFHAVINIAADSRRLALLLATVTNQLPRRFYASIEGQGDDTREQHPRIIDCLQRRDAEEARKIMEEHVIIGAELLISTLTQRGLWSKDEETRGEAKIRA